MNGVDWGGGGWLEGGKRRREEEEWKGVGGGEGPEGEGEWISLLYSFLALIEVDWKWVVDWKE